MACGSYEKFLALLMFNRVFNRQALILFCGNQRLASYYKTKAIANGHISENKITKRERVRHTYTTFNLTKAGFLYLMDHDKSITYFMPSEDLHYLRTIKRQYHIPERKIRLARDSEVCALVNAAGIAIPYKNFTTSLRLDQMDDGGDAEELSIEDYIKGNLTAKVYKELSLFEKTEADEQGIVFHNGTVMKASAGEANDYVSIRDYLAGRYNGVADSRFKSILLFTAPVFGMGWHKWVVEKEITALNIWKKTKSFVAEEYRFQSGAGAALIVHNAQQFANLYFDVDNAKRDANEEFGGDYQTLYILPSNEDGAKQLHWLMLTDDEAFDKQTIDDAIESGAYSRNDGANKSLFPLLNEFHQRTALGFQLDAKKMLKIEHAAKSIPHETFEIICQPWQEEYYRKVMPENVAIKLIDLE